MGVSRIAAWEPIAGLCIEVFEGRALRTSLGAGGGRKYACSVLGVPNMEGKEGFRLGRSADGTFFRTFEVPSVVFLLTFTTAVRRRFALPLAN